MERWKAVAHLGVRAGSLAGLLLLVCLHFLLPPGVVLWWFSCALLACAGHMSYMPITGLRIFLECHIDWLWFPGMTTFLLASYMFGLGAWTPMGTLLGWTLTAHTFMWRYLGKRGQPGALVKVPLHLLTRRGYGTEAGPTHETRVVMCANNVVEVCQDHSGQYMCRMGNMTHVACACPWFHQTGRLEYEQVHSAYAAPAIAPME